MSVDQTDVKAATLAAEACIRRAEVAQIAFLRQLGINIYKMDDGGMFLVDRAMVVLLTDLRAFAENAGVRWRDVLARVDEAYTAKLHGWRPQD